MISRAARSRSLVMTSKTPWLLSDRDSDGEEWFKIFFSSINEDTSCLNGAINMNVKRIDSPNDWPLTLCLLELVVTKDDMRMSVERKSSRNDSGASPAPSGGHWFDPRFQFRSIFWGSKLKKRTQYRPRYNIRVRTVLDLVRLALQIPCNSSAHTGFITYRAVSLIEIFW